jgi:GDP/UDP-N,N'-diacetylbacillosamine 2-epimerase (hydrolysing)
MTKKSLCVVTGTRAEYGLLRPVLQKLLQSAVIEPRLVVTGAHLAPEFGNTVSEIEADGMPIAARIPILKFGTGSPLATARTVSYTMERFTDYFSQNRPDAVLVLGDRYEIFAAGAAAALLERGCNASYRHIAVPNNGLTHASVDELRARFGLDAASLAAAIMKQGDVK